MPAALCGHATTRDGKTTGRMSWLSGKEKGASEGSDQEVSKKVMGSKTKARSTGLVKYSVSL